MVFCIVVGCSKRSGRDKDVSFYRIPVIRRGRSQRELELSKARRDGFLAAISRKDLTESILENERICSRHFTSGKPADLFDELNPDWLPTQNLGHSKRKQSVLSEDRYQRKKARVSRVKRESAHDETVMEQQTPSTGVVEVRAEACQVQVQTEETAEDIASLRSELNTAYSTIRTLQEKIERITPFTQASMQAATDDFIQHYTGLPNYKLLNTVFDFVAPKERNTKLSSFQEFMVTLIKLRLNLTSQDLAYRFDVHPSTISRILLKWLTVMDVRLRQLVMWPERENLRKTMPECFRASFGEKVAVVIDCFEVFIERPSNLLARSCTWSSYKHHNTIKFLIGITPQGVVSYISDAWGGRVSDKYLTEHCGVLQNLLPGDIVLADRGFNISDSVGIQQAKLHIPAFTKGKDQLLALEVEETRTIANVRIHVERVIGCVRQKYTILQGTLPKDFITKRVCEECPLIDRIARICCALCNLCDSVVPFD